MRKPIGVATGGEGNLDVVVVCDDGAVFYWGLKEAKWAEFEPIPGTIREEQKLGASGPAAIVVLPELKPML